MTYEFSQLAKEDERARRELGDHAALLRTTHFAVVLTSIALLVAAMSIDPWGLERARSNARDIVRAQRLLSDSAWLLTFEGVSHAGADPDSNSEINQGWTGTISLAGELVTSNGIVSDNVTIGGRDHGLWDISTSSSKAKFSTAVSSATLRDWKEVWNAFPDSVRVCSQWRPHDSIQLVPLSGSDALRSQAQERHIDTGSAAPTARSLTSESLSPVSDTLFAQWYPASDSADFVGTVREQGSGRAWRASVRARCRTRGRIYGAPRLDLARQLHAEWSNASFDSAFYSLNRLSSKYQDQPFDTLQRHLAEGDQIQDGQAEVGGVRMPTRSICQWGALLLSALMLYFATSLHRFRVRLRQARITFEFPWIALYDDWVAQILCWFSIVALPLISAIALSHVAWAHKSDSLGPQDVIHNLSILAVVAITIYAGYYIDTEGRIIGMLRRTRQSERRTLLSGDRRPLEKTRLDVAGELSEFVEARFGVRYVWLMRGLAVGMVIMMVWLTIRSAPIAIPNPVPLPVVALVLAVVLVSWIVIFARLLFRDHIGEKAEWSAVIAIWIVCAVSSVQLYRAIF